MTNESEAVSLRAKGLFSIAYPGCVEASSPLLAVLGRYSFEDACKAVFCILSWHQNRSAQTCAHALNAALLRHARDGKTSVGTYDEFVSLFDEVKAAATVYPLEDVVLPVMGQVKLAFHGSWWGSIYGCGMTGEYPRLCFADSLCEAAGKAEEFERVLRYVSDMGDALDGGGWDCGEGNAPDLLLPPRSHWDRVEAWFCADGSGRLDADVVSELSNGSLPVERRHFIQSGDGVLPLFNPSILYDCLEALVKGTDDECLRGAVEVALLMQVRSSFPSGPVRGAGHIAFPCFRVDGKLFENCPASFLVYGDGPSATLFFNLEGGDGNLVDLKNLFAGRTEPIEILEPPMGEGHVRGLTLQDPSHCDLNVVAYYDDTIIDPFPKAVRRSHVADVTCGATDVMAMLQMAASAEELNAFFNWLKTSNCRFMQGFSGYSDLFCCWRDEGRLVATGAEDAGGPLNVLCDFNETDGYYVRLFSETLVDYPFVGGSFPLGSPFDRAFDRNERGFLAVGFKTGAPPLGLTKRLEDSSESYIHLCVETGSVDKLSLDELEEEARFHPFVDDVFMILAGDARPEFSRLALALGGVLRIEYVAEKGADEWGLRPVCDELGARAALLRGSDGCPVAAFSLNRDKFYGALSASADRRVECDLACSVLSVLPVDSDGSRDALLAAIGFLRGGKKKVDVVGVELPYIWRRAVPRPGCDEISKARAIKKVALAANRAGVQPGKYYGADAKGLLRGFRSTLFDELKSELDRYDKETLVVSLYEFLADAMSERFVHTARLGAFGQVEETELARVNDATLDMREEARAESRAACCCIETVLAFGSRGEERAKATDIANLVSLADQYLSLSDVSDRLSFEPKGLGVDVAANLTSELIEDADLVSDSRVLRMRQLLDPGHAGSRSTKDAEFVKRAKDAFEMDTDVSFDCLMGVLDTLALGVDDGPGNFVSPNVMTVSEGSLVSFLLGELGDVLSAQQLSLCLTILELDERHIALEGAGGEKYIPFGRTKDRPNRLELKPIVSLDGNLLFSPAAMGMLRRRWLSGLAERSIPAKDAYPELYKVVKEWKSLYEKALEEDVRACFVEHGFDAKSVFKSLKLHKYGDHPGFLGDYDVLAYDDSRGAVWVIECKEYEKVESAYDYMQLQKRWFGEKGDLQKFERRVSYIKENLTTVLADLGSSANEETEVVPLLVCNKLFVNMLGESSFEVVSLNELAERIADQGL